MFNKSDGEHSSFPLFPLPSHKYKHADAKLLVEWHSVSKYVHGASVLQFALLPEEKRRPVPNEGFEMLVEICHEVSNGDEIRCHSDLCNQRVQESERGFEDTARHLKQDQQIR